MRLEFGFGCGVQTVELPEANLAGVLRPNAVEHALTNEQEIRRAFSAPIGSAPLREIVKPGEKIAIVTSDITRPMPTYMVMPPLLEELSAAGVVPDDITLVFALGNHRKHTQAEMEKLAGPQAWHTVRCVDSDPCDIVHIGSTSRGTPVDIFRAVAEADRRVCLGNIEYHYFAGYSGGGKAIMPGVSTREAIQANHRRMVEASSCAGRLEGNPVREDIEEAAGQVGIDFILNVVLDEKKQVIHAVAGDPILAHRVGCQFLDRFYKIALPRRADIILVSQGGAPKDLNLYQVQKALDNAKHAVRKGGIIILIGSCNEGLGEKVFEDWITAAPSSRSLIDRIQADFQLGGHKAAAIAMVLEDADIYLVSELSPELVNSIFLQPFSSAQQALDAAFQKLGKDAAVLAMPYGGSTLPDVG